MTSLIGERFGNLVVVGDTTKRNSRGEILWDCRCECGQHSTVRTSKLTSGATVSCGCRGEKSNPIDHSNLKKLKKYRGRKDFKNIDEPVKLKLLSEYVQEGTDHTALAEKYNLHPLQLRNFISTFRDKLNNTYELNYLINTQKTVMPQTSIDKALSRSFVEEKLKDLLSPAESSVLTEAEQVYGWVYAKTGSNDTALKESGFTTALKVKDTARKNLLGMLLREKPNLAQFITEQQQINIERSEVTKKYVQSELVRQVEQLKEMTTLDNGNSSNRAQLLKSIELLGRTIGAFEDKIKVEEVDPSKALDRLIQLSKEEYVIEDSTRDTDETPEYLPE